MDKKRRGAIQFYQKEGKAGVYLFMSREKELMVG